MVKCWICLVDLFPLGLFLQPPPSRHVENMYDDRDDHDDDERERVKRGEKQEDAIGPFGGSDEKKKQQGPRDETGYTIQ